MRWVSIAGLVVLCVGVAGGARPSALWNFYRQLYPGDPAQRQALDACFMRDPSFNRLDPVARAACYEHEHTAVVVTREESSQPHGNFVDRWHAAGEGHLPQNDIRHQERDGHYLDRLTAGR